MPAGNVRRVLRDFTQVCQRSSPATAARWSAALMVNLPECTRHRSLQPADRSWELAGAKFRTSTGAIVALPGPYTAGAREMYCRNVYLRTGLTMPTEGWVVDLGANRGLFSVWAAINGARTIAVEAQQSFAREIRNLAVYNGVYERIHVEIALASGVTTSGAFGHLADDRVWSNASHAEGIRPVARSMPNLMGTYGIDHIGLMKMDIEGAEFAVLAASENLSWLSQVDQLAIELHGGYGDVTALIDRLRGHGLIVDLRDDVGHIAAATSSSVAYAYCRR